MSIVGIFIGRFRESGKRVSPLLKDLNNISFSSVSILIKVAVLGLGIYFAVVMAEQDVQIMVSFGRTFIICSLVYLGIAFTCYAWIFGG